MLKTRFAFLYASTSLHTKTLTVTSNRNFESFRPIRCVAPQRILRFFAAGFAFTFAFGNSARYCVVLLNVLLSDREKKKKLSYPARVVCESLLAEILHRILEGIQLI